MLARIRLLWPHVVAAFVLYHVVSNALDCIPEVSMGMNKAAWHEPRVRHELDVWAARLGAERRSFEDQLWELGQTFQGVRRAVLTPFRPYLNATAQHQAWAMFIAGTRDRDSFAVRARTCSNDDECPWRTLYARDDAAHAFMRDVLESPRVRSAIFRWGWPQNKAAYQRGCRAIAKRAFDDDTTLHEVQCRFERTSAPDGNGAVLHKPSWGREIAIARGDVE